MKIKKIMIDNFYELNYLNVIEETDEKISLQVNFDLDIYPDFHEYCGDKVMSSGKILLQYDKEELSVMIIGCSFTLGRIFYDDNEEIESVDTNATGVLEFRK